MLETIFAGLAILGILTVIFGRHTMIVESGGDLPFLWIIALRLIPFAELMYMVRHFDTAKRGGIMAIVGMWLTVPHFALDRHQAEGAYSALNQPAAAEYRAEGESQDEAEGDYSELPAELASAAIHENSRNIAEAERQAAQLARLLTWWYGTLEEKRAKAAGDEAALAAFNKEAAAYSALNAIANEQAAELAAMRLKARN